MAESRPPDILTLHAQLAPTKPAVIHDRPDGTIQRWTFAELEDAGEPARERADRARAATAARSWSGAGRTRPESCA